MKEMNSHRGTFLMDGSFASHRANCCQCKKAMDGKRYGELCLEGSILFKQAVVDKRYRMRHA